MITRRMGLTLTCLISMFICWSLVADAQSGGGHAIEVLDASHWDFSKRFPLIGNWSVVENKLVEPASISNENLSTAFFPSIWNDHRADGKGIGYATYALDVLVPDSLNLLSLEIPALYNCYSIWSMVSCWRLLVPLALARRR